MRSEKALRILIPHIFSISMLCTEEIKYGYEKAVNGNRRLFIIFKENILFKELSDFWTLHKIGSTQCGKI